MWKFSFYSISTILVLIVAFAAFGVLTHRVSFSWVPEENAAEHHDEHEESCAHDEHDEHEENKENGKHEEHAEIALSPSAAKNIGLVGPNRTFLMEPGTFTRTHSIPAIIMEFSGRTTSNVPAPYAGIITKIYHEPGESVRPGEPLFDVTLSLPEMQDAQVALLKLCGTQAFLEAEIAEIDSKLNGLAPERRRELDVRLKETKIEITTQKDVLQVLGLPSEIVERLIVERKPISHSVIVRVPPVSHHGFISEQNPGEMESSVVFETLYVNVGKRVESGDTLCDVCDLCELTVRGDAFAVNEGILLDALQNPETRVRVTFDGNRKQALENLHLRMVESKIDEKNRTISCFTDFPNVKVTDDEPEQGTAAASQTHPHRPHYIHWLYKAGERCQMEIAYEKVENVVIVPVDAVAQDVNETYVFELEEETKTGETIWVRHPVHVLFRTKECVVIENSGGLPLGKPTAARSASFLQEALSALNGTGTKIDPHAGHNH